MWINLTTSPSVPAAADSTSDLNWLSEQFARFVGWSGKPLPSNTWRRRWNTLAWVKHLFGLTCALSMVAPGVESWIASLRATRANRSASRVTDVDKMILATCGHTSIESLAKLNQHSYFLKTYPDTSPSASSKSFPTLTAWITRLRQDSSQRQKLAQAKNGSDFSLWPAPAATMTAGEDKDATWIPGQKPTRWGKVVQTALTTCAKIWMRDYLSSLHGQTTMGPGPISSKTTKSSPLRLNPLFVRWLMGWPDSDFSATEWSRYRQRMRSSLFGLLSNIKEPHD